MADDVETHGVGNEELPDVVTPEEFIDRFTHQSAYNAIMMIESALILAKPTPSVDGTYVAVTFAALPNGRISDIIKQQYVDKGWKNVSIATVNVTSSSIKLYFP